MKRRGEGRNKAEEEGVREGHTHFDGQLLREAFVRGRKRVSERARKLAS